MPATGNCSLMLHHTPRAVGSRAVTWRGDIRRRAESIFRRHRYLAPQAIVQAYGIRPRLVIHDWHPYRAWHGRYYQLLSGHAAIGSFLHDRMTGPQRLDTEKCWWCSCRKRQMRHHLFTGCWAWAPQVRRLWKRVGRDCQWQYPSAPSARWLRGERATEAVLECLGGTRVGVQGVGWEGKGG